MTARSDPATGTSDQKPRWEGPPENRPRGYLPAKDNPEIDPDAAGKPLARSRTVADDGGDNAKG